jgi:hypothetical protein
MSYSTIYVGRTNEEPPRIKAVSDKDCLPDNMVDFAQFITTANMTQRGDVSERFWHHYEKMKWLEQLGFHIEIDFGSHFYETGSQGPEVLDVADA